jgi:SAM-dependent methyltransferase
MIPPKLRRLEHRLACPEDGAALAFSEAAADCGRCGRSYPIRDGRIYFTTPLRADDALDSIKERAKRRFGSTYYRVLRPLLAPAYPFDYRGYVLRHVDPEREVVVDLGSGNHRMHPAVFALDGMDYPHIDIVCDMRRLPFRPGAIDAFASSSVLEHVFAVEDVLAQIDRATRTGGHSIHIIPFMYPFHASPDDFQRFTHIGAARMLRGWRIERQVAAAGPFTLFNAVAAELVAAILSLGSQRAKAPLYLLASTLLAPLKFLDWPFVGRRALLAICPVILTHLVKPPEAMGPSA